jgi:hypothetical protein
MDTVGKNNMAQDAESSVNLAKVFESFKEKELANMDGKQKDNYVTKFLYALLRA